MAALTACAGPPAAPAPTPTSTVTTTSPRIDVAHDLTDVDVCALLTAADVKGPFVRPPAPFAGPGTCEFRAPTGLRLGLVITQRSYDDAKPLVLNGSEQVIDGHSTWWATGSDGTMTHCDMVVALTADHVLEVRAEQYPMDVVRIGSQTRVQVQSVLSRLPRK
ncbi:hypothetical protein BBK82_19430 [Lentzea guizhouensis]|uniref:DUF3558 domain-containing protein n=1 Tax=Lentzea guizhouensis TaxID=1586287 RepID=A0A1B2HJJ4_9PSEU|nr:hypothetical protein BBK82_19430 [Lentzea guizhouensis]